MNSQVEINYGKIQIVTQLKEVYETNDNEHIATNIEPIYEAMREKFRKVYNCDEPEFYVRVPYTHVLFGDNVTKLFTDKIVTNGENDMIICAHEKEGDELNIEIFDQYFQRLKYNISTSKEQREVYDFGQGEYFISAYQSGIFNTKTTTYKGANVLVIFNETHLEDQDVILSTFIGFLVCSLYIHKGLTNYNRYSLYELVFNEICKLGNFAYCSSLIYFKFFLEKNAIGIHSGDSFSQYKFEENEYILLCDSLSTCPIMAYSSVNYWNKRKVETKLAMALILKRYKNSFTLEDINAIARDINSFLRYFEYNFDTIFEMLEIYLKKGQYNLKEIKEELQFDLGLYLNEIDYWENVIMTKDYFLYKRVYYLFREYHRIIKISNAISNEDQVTVKKIFSALLTESCSEMKNYYDCFSDKVASLINIITQFNADICIKLISTGWSGEIAVLGEKQQIDLIQEFLMKYYESVQSQENVNGWISDDMCKYCYSSQIGGASFILNPVYSDFMLDYVDKKL